MRRYLFLFLLTVSLLWTSCDQRDIHEVIRQMTEAPVNTQGFSRSDIQTNGFSAVEVDCFADVTFHQTKPGGSSHVVLQAPEEVLENVICKVSDNLLQITLNSRYKMPEKTAIVAHIHAPFVNKFVLNGGKCLRLGQLKLTSPLEIENNGLASVSADLLEACELRIQQNGVGCANLKGIICTLLVAETEDAGTIRLGGQCQQARVTARDNSCIHVTDLHSTRPVVEKKTGNGRIINR